jgi:hypothetical protein
MGQSIEFEVKSEPWTTYQLEDGTVVKAKVIMLDVVRLEEFNEQTGEPIYQFAAQHIIAVQVPEELKKKTN